MQLLLFFRNKYASFSAPGIGKNTKKRLIYWGIIRIELWLALALAYYGNIGLEVTPFLHFRIFL